MNDPSLQTQIDAANTYEALFVPALFGQWAPKVADAAQIQPGHKVLDVACGTGILARESASRVGSNGYVAGIDPNLGMLAVAKQLAPDIEWREGVAESLPFPDQFFDVVVSQFGFMFFANRYQALHEILRVLVPGGCLAIAVWNSLDNLPAYASEVALLERTAGQRAADALRAPFVLGNRSDLSILLSDAGVASAKITTHHGIAQFPSIRTMMESDLRGWLPVMGVILTEDQIRQILQEADEALKPYIAADGKMTFDVSAQLATGKKP